MLKNDLLKRIAEADAEILVCRKFKTDNAAIFVKEGIVEAP